MICLSMTSTRFISVTHPLFIHCFINMFLNAKILYEHFRLQIRCQLFVSMSLSSINFCYYMRLLPKSLHSFHLVTE